MKKLNLLLTLSMALLCTTQPTKAENSWTSWVAPAIAGTAAAISGFLLYKEHTFIKPTLDGVNNNLGKLQQIENTIKNTSRSDLATPKGRTKAAHSIEQTLNEIDQTIASDIFSDSIRTNVSLMKQNLPDMLQDDIANSDLANVKPTKCATYENDYHYTPLPCNHGVTKYKSLSLAQQMHTYPWAHSCNPYKTYSFAKNYKACKEGFQERKRELEPTRFKLAVATGALSALTLGLVAYNLK